MYFQKILRTAYLQHNTLHPLIHQKKWSVLCPNDFQLSLFARSLHEVPKLFSVSSRFLSSVFVSNHTSESFLRIDPSSGAKETQGLVNCAGSGKNNNTCHFHNQYCDSKSWALAVFFFLALTFCHSFKVSNGGEGGKAVEGRHTNPIKEFAICFPPSGTTKYFRTDLQNDVPFVLKATITNTKQVSTTFAHTQVECSKKDGTNVSLGLINLQRLSKTSGWSQCLLLSGTGWFNLFRVIRRLIEKLGQRFKKCRLAKKRVLEKGCR